MAAAPARLRLLLSCPQAFAWAVPPPGMPSAPRPLPAEIPLRGLLPCEGFPVPSVTRKRPTSLLHSPSGTPLAGSNAITRVLTHPTRS